MAEIRILDEQVANQIAAGEVVERPASVVKELVENALDAGATAIVVETRHGGRFLRVTDNGQGIPPDSLKLAFQRFATSKLTDFSDIWNLRTMGFRGEALPSIASISKIEVISRISAQELGRRIILHGGSLIEETDAGSAVGTRLTVDGLFYNTPARLKFMRTDNTEYGYISQLISAFSLCYPEVSFKWIKEGKEQIYTAGGNSLTNTLRQLYGKELAESLYTLEHENDLGKVTGALSYPNFVRRDRNRQLFFVNRRWVEIPALKKLLDDIYENLVPKRHYPVAILNIEIPSDQVDVNVHPTKKEVRFKQFYRIAKLIKQAIDMELSAYRMVEKPMVYPLASSSPEEQAPFETQTVMGSQEPITAYSTPVQLTLESLPLPPPHEKNEVFRSSPQDRGNEALKEIRPISQTCDNTYIVAHYGNGLALIDQHIADERYKYETLLSKQEMSSQRLLVSVILELDALDKGLMEEHLAIFEKLGFEIEAFGPSSIAIRAVPQYLEHVVEVEGTIRQMLQDLRESGIAKTRIDQYNLLCKTVACHGAVRAGDPLTAEQIQVLITHWVNTQNPYTCPHGRPILIRFSKHELDRRFMRI